MAQKNKKPFFSIITPTYNRAHVIKCALDSVYAQTRTDITFEIIVCDDGSTDSTSAIFSPKICKQRYPNLLYLPQKKNQGVNHARNVAITRATGKYLIFLDSDDALLPNAFEVIYGLKDKLGKINLFLTAIKDSDKMFTTIKEQRKYSYCEWLEGKVIGGEFLSVVQRSVFDSDMFDEDRFCFESFFWNRVVKKYGVTGFPQALRVYSFDGADRLNRKLVDPKYAAKRFDDYTRYINAFRDDFIACELHSNLAQQYNRAAIFALLAGNKSACIKNCNESLMLKRSLLPIGLKIMTNLPQKMVLVIYSVLSKSL